MKKSKIGYVLLVMALLGSLLAACSKSNKVEPKESASAPLPVGSDHFNLEGLPIVKEPITLTFAAAQHPHFEPGFADMDMIKRWAEETNITIKWITTPIAAWQERKSQIIASGELQDVFAGGGHLNDEEVTQWGMQELLRPLNDLIDPYMPNFKRILEENPHYKDIITSPDGKIYSFPAVADIDFGNRGAVLFLNRQLLEETGRVYPVQSSQFVESLDHTFTIDEFYHYLKDVKRLHPASIPFTHVSDGQPFGGLYDLYSSWGRPDDSMRIVVEDGTVTFTADKPEWQEATQFFHKLYQEKLLDQEYFTQDYSMMLAKLSKDPLNVGAVLLWTAQQAESDMNGAKYRNWVITAPPVGPSGETLWPIYPKGLTRGSFAISSTSKYPEIAARFQDYLYGADNSYQLSLGPYGSNVKKNSDGTLEMLNKPDDVTEKQWTGQNLNTMFITTPDMNAKVKWADPVQMTIDVGAVYKNYQSTIFEKYPNILFSEKDNERLSVIQVDIQNYVKKMQAKWITEGTMEADWTSYLNELKRIGLEEYLTIMQKNYDRIKGN